MLNNNVLEYLEKEIKNLEEAIAKTKIANELLKINIKKKELLLEKLTLQ